MVESWFVGISQERIRRGSFEFLEEHSIIYLHNHSFIDLLLHDIIHL